MENQVSRTLVGSTRLLDPQEQFATQALRSTQLAATPQQLREWFVSRWQMAVTFEEARAPLGMETQRQGRRKPSPARRPACWVCTRSSAC